MELKLSEFEDAVIKAAGELQEAVDACRDLRDLGPDNYANRWSSMVAPDGIRYKDGGGRSNDPLHVAGQWQGEDVIVESDRGTIVVNPPPVESPRKGHLRRIIRL